jgi:hypothetical protein
LQKKKRSKDLLPSPSTWAFKLVICCRLNLPCAISLQRGTEKTSFQKSSLIRIREYTNPRNTTIYNHSKNMQIYPRKLLRKKLESNHSLDSEVRSCF